MGIHAVSHPGYLPDWHVDIQAVFLLKGTFFFDEQWAWEEGQAYKIAA